MGDQDQELERIRRNERMKKLVSAAKSNAQNQSQAKEPNRADTVTAEEKGRELQRMLKKKQNVSRTEEPAPEATADSLDPLALSAFRKMCKGSGRLSRDELGLDVPSLLEKLGLSSNGVMKRAAVLLFHENPQTSVPGACIHIGMFEGADLLFEDRLDGPLISAAKQAVDLVLTKYTITTAVYEGTFRKDADPYPKQALREAIMNAIVHNDYSEAAPIQIKVTRDSIVISNSGGLPQGQSIRSVSKTDAYEPRNPSLAKAFYLAGMAGAPGGGMSIIADAYKGRSAEPPAFSDGPRFSVTFRSEAVPVAPARGRQQPFVKKEGSPLQAEVQRVLKDGPMSTSEIMAALSCDMERSNFVGRILTPLREWGVIEYTIPDKVNSRNQKYKLTGS